ncbi:MAG: hypothetical protein KatS3mg089_0211 [Patescibacteria group bacterium]|nr:MAG: hypothetical protein KatS3mg089_0211 [Patescibacteria group bacterium]
MDAQSIQRIRDIISRSQSISIMVGENPTVDQMAAALSLYLTLSTGKKVSVFSLSTPLVEHSSLVGIDKVGTSPEGTGGDLVVSFPYKEGEIEKVSYTIENGYLNIIVKGGEGGLTFDEHDVLFKRGTGKVDLLITVGVESMRLVKNLFSEDALKEATVINIDNTNENSGYGDVVLVSNKFSSLSEQVADLLLNLGLDIDIDTAQNLLLGITEATNNFQSPQTSYLAFEIAAILLKRGAVRPQIEMTKRQDLKKEERLDIVRQSIGKVQESAQKQSPLPRSEQQTRQDQKMRSDRQSSEQKPPSDWLTPKVYKGSTNI